MSQQGIATAATIGAYRRACQREGVDCVLEALNAFNSGSRDMCLSHRKVALTDIDLCCLAEGLTAPHTIRVLDLGENAITMTGVQAIIDAITVNPGIVRELRLGKNNLKDPSCVAIGNALSAEGAGLKVLDVSENGMTAASAQAIGQALEARSCDLVELSFHCNELDHEAALFLAQATRISTRLKHLHLGYNALRDKGAIHMARTLPLSRSLLTLDLTANRIGREGGVEIVKALLSEHTMLQRINLRHNNFDDETIALFATVLEKNTRLTQLFLGYMNPSFETAQAVLDALADKNATLLCFDCFGWRFPTETGPQTLSRLLEKNHTLRSLITDAPFDEVVEVANQKRDEVSSFPVYVGGDDRLAAVAASEGARTAPPSTTRSVSRQPAQAVSPREPSTARSPVAVRTASPPRSSQGVYETQQAVSNSPTGASPPRSAPEDQTNGTTSAHPPARSPRTAVASSAERTADEDLDALLEELQYVPCDPELRTHISMIISQVQLKMEVQRSYHQQQLTGLEERVKALEQRPLLQQHQEESPRQLSRDRSPQEVKTATSPRGATSSTSPTRTSTEYKSPTSSERKPAVVDVTPSPHSRDVFGAEDVKERNDRIMTVQRERPEAIEERQSPAVAASEMVAVSSREEQPSNAMLEASPEPRPSASVSPQRNQPYAQPSRLYPGSRSREPTERSRSLREGSENAGGPMPLYIPPTERGESVRALSHSPSALLLEPAATPDLQHSAHQSTNSVLDSSVPPVQPKLPRPQGSRASGVK